LTPLNRNTKDVFPEGLLTKVLSDPFYRDYLGPVLVIHQGGEPQLLGASKMRSILEEVKACAPNARQTIVTNLFNAPVWFVEMAYEFFQGKIETTWAAGRKQSLAGREDVFQTMFRKSLKLCIEEGLSCPINIELNDDTFDAGPDFLIDMMLETGAKTAEFDISVDFAKFRKNPSFAQGNAPLLPPTIPYTKVSQYLLDFQRRLIVRGLKDRIGSHSIIPISHRGLDLPFNTRCEDRFLTLNPDGFITTIPLYSDIEETYLGNVHTDGMQKCLSHPNRLGRITYEMLRTGPCVGCVHQTGCQGGPSHVPVLDGSGECAGLKRVLDRLEAFQPS
jgi:sulfatase maturation enzyme AslB (radical SAM superfamily)